MPTEMESIVLLIATFFVSLFAVADQVRRIQNVRVKKMLGKLTDAHLVPSGILDEPTFAVIGIALASFYTLGLILKMALQGNLVSFVKIICQEKTFLNRLVLILLFWIIGTALAYYERFLEYMALVLIAIIVGVIIILIGERRKPPGKLTKEAGDSGPEQI
jgi:hypothetical protein